MGQLTPAQVTTSPRLLTMSRPRVLKGPYGQASLEWFVACLAAWRYRGESEEGVLMYWAQAEEASAAQASAATFIVGNSLTSDPKIYVGSVASEVAVGGRRTLPGIRGAF